MTNPHENENAIREVLARLEWMEETYYGCDWCCGGGDEEREYLVERLSDLGFYNDEYMTKETRQAWRNSISRDEIMTAGQGNQ